MHRWQRHTSTQQFYTQKPGVGFFDAYLVPPLFEAIDSELLRVEGLEERFHGEVFVGQQRSGTQPIRYSNFASAFLSTQCLCVKAVTVSELTPIIIRQQ